MNTPYKICVVGMGYVGLPLATLLARKYQVTGFDINPKKIEELKAGIDPIKELEPNALSQESLFFTSDPEETVSSDFYIVAVPTDITQDFIPDLAPLRGASRTVGSVLRKGDIVVYESTVYPGLTEEVCIPILEQVSGLKWKKDFNVGYSPERINPGDKLRPLHKILKIISADTPETLNALNEVYGSVIEAGVYAAPDIKTAEAAKVIENAQRDLNIAFMNELAVIFEKMDIDTTEVIKAAGTKWNFLKFEPGLVGGHCIGVDPYYLAYKAEQLGYTPAVIHSGRRVNNQMGAFIAQKIIRTLTAERKIIADMKILVMGLTFKENVNDTRNSKVIDVIHELEKYSAQVYRYDPHVPHYAKAPAEEERFDAIVLAVKHDDFRSYELSYLKSISTNEELYLFDIKGFYDIDQAKTISKSYWRL